MGASTSDASTAEHGTLTGPPLLVLTSLAAGPRHGHALMKDIANFAGVRLGPGTLYGAIARLEERGLIAPLPAEDRRRPYEITAAGARVLEASVAALGNVVTAGMARLRTLQGQGDPAPRAALQGGAP